MAEQNGMEKPDLQALPTINDRMTFLYLEHCKIHREDGAITARDSGRHAVHSGGSNYCAAAWTGDRHFSSSHGTDR